MQCDIRRTILAPEQVAVEESEHPSETTNRTAAMIVDWAQKRKLQRLRSDRQVGVPEKERLTEWLAMFEGRGLTDEERIFSVLDAARAAADRCGRWRNWAFLTFQIQLSVERWEADRSPSGVESQTCSAPPAEAQDTIWGPKPRSESVRKSPKSRSVIGSPAPGRSRSADHG